MEFLVLLVHGIRKETPMYNTKTKNLSFITMWHYLQDQGIENNIFMLELKDESLINFDITDLYTNNKEEKSELLYKVRQECKNNIWFFFREVVRIPNVLSSTMHYRENYPRFVLTPELMFLIYAYEHNLSIIADYKYQKGYYTLALLLEIYHKFILDWSNYIIYYLSDIFMKDNKYEKSLLSSNFSILNGNDVESVMLHDKRHFYDKSTKNLSNQFIIFHINKLCNDWNPILNLLNYKMNTAKITIFGVIEKEGISILNRESVDSSWLLKKYLFEYIKDIKDQALYYDTNHPEKILENRTLILL